MGCEIQVLIFASVLAFSSGYTHQYKKDLRSDTLCVNGEGGVCQDYREEVCTAGYATGLCDGDVNRRCCLPCDAACQEQEDIWSQNDGACMSIGGDCQMNSNYCPGTYMSGKCGGPSERQCCRVVPAPDPEFRAMFVSTVSNIDWPLSMGQSSDAQKQQMIDILDTAVDINFNAIMFQIRPASDALYESSIEPWSKYISGTQGVAPSPYYDPLDFVISEAHARGIEVHVWLNPYRGGLQTTYSGLASNHICNTLREYCYIYDRYLWLDPGAPEVADNLLNVISDIVQRYDIDGLHFDDYFYPYPDGSEFPDDKTYNDYQISGGTLSRDDWRRDNVNRMVQNVHDTIRSLSENVVFSISPFGIYRPGHPDGMPSPIVGMDPYTEQFADTKLWLLNGWVDFMAPQLYWKIDPPAQSYPILLDWWLDVNQERYIYAANGLYRIAENGWPNSEIINQIALSRDETRRAHGSLGNIHFTTNYIRDNYNGIKDELSGVCGSPASTPSYPWIGSTRTGTISMKSIKVDKLTVQIVQTPEDPKAFRTWLIHRVSDDGSMLELVKTLPRWITEIQLSQKGRYSIRLRNAANVEGEPIFFDV